VARYEDRRDAGRILAAALSHLAERTPVVLGLPRGGVVVAATVAALLDAPLDVLVVRKVGAPHQPELAMGAVGEDGASVVNDRVVAQVGIGGDALARAVLTEQAEVRRRAQLLRSGRPPIALQGRTGIVVDDGIATGATIRAACRVARARGVERLVVAVPVAPPRTVEAMRALADDVVCPFTPPKFLAVGAYYGDFREVTDDEVGELLDEASSAGSAQLDSE
jgi:putative phosphoribosyl transferase